MLKTFNYSIPECDSQCSEDALPTEVPHQPHHPQLDAHVLQLIPIQKSSPERRTSQKEIIAGEERPKFLTIKQIQDGQGSFLNNSGSNQLICKLFQIINKQFSTMMHNLYINHIAITFNT